MGYRGKIEWTPEVGDIVVVHNTVIIKQSLPETFHHYTFEAMRPLLYRFIYKIVSIEKSGGTHSVTIQGGDYTFEVMLNEKLGGITPSGYLRGTEKKAFEDSSRDLNSLMDILSRQYSYSHPEGSPRQEEEKNLLEKYAGIDLARIQTG